MERWISVAASGRVPAEPDMAVISAGVVAEGDTARGALDANSTAMRRVIDALVAAGIDRKDIQTAHFHIEPRYRHPKDGRPSEVTGYRVANQVRITVRDLARLGGVLDEVVSEGANQAGGIEFQVSRAETLKDDARKAAMANARRRAELLAEAAGARLGPVVTIAEDAQGGGPLPVVGARMAMASAEAVPVEPGRQMLEARVQVTWALVA
jgi:hypothetical protein